VSSATPSNPAAARRDAIYGPSGGEWTTARGARLGMSQRQIELNRLWGFYRCTQYADRSIDWNGYPVLDHSETGAVVQAGFVPPGFFDAGATLPLKYRRPSAPYYLGKVIVDRFTGLLFSKKRHPKIVCLEDPKTEDWLNACVEVMRLWPEMIQARTYGGAMGSVAISFKFVEGQPEVEVHDPRWCFPEFFDRSKLTLRRLEKRYQFPCEEFDHEKKEWVTVWYWYRRVIDTAWDVVWEKVPVGDGDEPDWQRFPHEGVNHGFGFCPAVWVQNRPVQDDIDGDPDCHGAFEMIEQIDCLLSQAHRGTVANCDPTLLIAAEAEFEGELRKGSDNAIKLPNGGTASYLEITGAGPRAAMELAKQFREYVLEVTRCVLDTNFDGPARTEKEVSANFSSMLEQADVLREQYGERGVKRLLELILRAARKLERTTVVQRDDGTPEIVRHMVHLPPKVEHDPDTGEVTITPREIGSGIHISLDWGDFETPSQQDVQAAVDAAGKAKTYGLIDQETASRYVARFFQVQNLKKMLENIEKERPEAPDLSVFGIPGAVSEEGSPGFGPPEGG